MISRFVKVYIDGNLDVRPIQYIRRDGRPMPKLADCEMEIIFSSKEPSVIVKQRDNLRIENKKEGFTNETNS